MTNCPGLIVVTARPTSSTMPQYSWPIGAGPLDGVETRDTARDSDPQMQVADSRMIASVGSMTRRVRAIVEAHVARTVENCSSHDLVPSYSSASSPVYISYPGFL